MNSQTSLIAQQTRLNEWAEQIRECNNRPQGMTEYSRVAGSSANIRTAYFNYLKHVV